jgi:hypothetical protein
MTKIGFSIGITTLIWKKGKNEKHLLLSVVTATGKGVPERAKVYFRASVFVPDNRKSILQ